MCLSLYIGGAMTAQTYETIVETEETLTPEEFLARRKEGKIDPENVKISLPTAAQPFGGFKVKLDTPRYKANFGRASYA
jgi:hypothetical protein